MFFPKGEVRHQDLSTAYTDLAGLLMALKSEGFSGTVELSFPDLQGVLFVVSGEVVNGETRKVNESERIVGEEAVRTLTRLVHRKDGILNVYRLPPDRVSVAANNLESEILFKGLSTDFTRLDRLMVKLREEKHDGFIEFLGKDNKPMGVLFFHQGEVVDLYNTMEPVPSVVDRKLIPAFLENVSKQAITLNVYKSRARAPVREIPPRPEEENLGESILLLGEIVSRVEKLADGECRMGAFQKAFRRALIERAEAYPFLDPFAGEFSYQDGSIAFKGEARCQEFVRGIGESLRGAITHLEMEFPKKKMLPLKLRAEVESILEEKEAELKRLGIDTILSTLLE